MSISTETHTPKPVSSESLSRTRSWCCPLARLTGILYRAPTGGARVFLRNNAPKVV